MVVRMFWQQFFTLAKFSQRRLLSPQNVRVSGMVMFSVFVSFETSLTCSFMNLLSFHAVKTIL